MATEEELKDEVLAIQKMAEEAGLDFFDVNFEVITKKSMVEFGTYALPSRFSHWTFGQEYSRLRKFHELGIMEILEMVINADPSIAFLLDSNTLWQNQMVIAHVFGHVDFFKNNMWFDKTNRNILEASKFWEERVAELEFEHGKKVVEAFLDKVLSIQWHVDFYDQFRGPRGQKKVIPKVDFSDYRLDEKEVEVAERPRLAEKDLLRFLMNHAHLDQWQKELISMVREETLYFIPQMMTKTMNEGWATYWHTRLMADVLDFTEYNKFSVQQSQLMASQGLNPYKVGYLIYKSIEAEWDQRDGEGAGLKKIFEVRQFEDDVSFIRQYLTQDICEAAGLFLWEKDPSTGEITVTSKEVDDIRESILAQLTGFGKPVIVVRDGDFMKRNELYLEHLYHEGRELQAGYAMDVLKNIFQLWGRAIHLETVLEGERVLYSISEEGQQTTRLDQPEIEDDDAEDDDTPTFPF